MPSVNKVILVGHLGKDPEVREMQNGSKIVSASLATSESWSDKQTGNKQESTEWHRLIFFGKVGETAEKYLKKGSLVYVEGSIRTNEWQDQNTGEKKSMVQIRVDRMQMLGGKSADTGPVDKRAPVEPTPLPPARKASYADKDSLPYEELESDIPF